MCHQISADLENELSSIAFSTDRRKHSFGNIITLRQALEVWTLTKPG